MILSVENISKIEKSDLDVLMDRLERVKGREGNPMEVEIKRFGEAFAFSVQQIPGPAFNIVKGMTEKELPHLEAILEFYSTKEIPVRFEIAPSNAAKTLLRHLSMQGFYHCGFHTTLYEDVNDAVSIIEKSTQTSVKVEEISEDTFNDFGDVYTQGFGMPSFLKKGVTQNNKILLENENWIFYLARIEGEPAGVGVLFVKDGVGTLAASATVPEYRNRGVQTALIRRRMVKAKESGCQMVVGQAAFGSVSMNNMERAGMKVAYTPAIWEKR